MAFKKDDLSILIPSLTIALSVGEVALKPFKFKQVPLMLELVEKYSQLLFEGKEVEIDGEKVLVDKSSGEIIKELLAKTNGNYGVLLDVQKVIQLVSPELEEKDIDDLGYDEVFYLLSQIFEQNRDFFQRLMEKVNPKKSPVQTLESKITESESPA